MIPIAIGVFILSLSGIFFNQVAKVQTDVKGVTIEVNEKVVASSEPISSPDPTKSPEPSQKPQSSSNVTIKNGSVKTDVVINNNVNTDGTSNKSNSNFDKNSFKYPGANVTSENNQSLELTSSDDPDKITDWYKEKIRALGLNSKSFVTTKSNDNVENKLVGGDGNLEVAVEIKKPAASNTVTIKISAN